GLDPRFRFPLVYHSPAGRRPWPLTPTRWWCPIEARPMRIGIVTDVHDEVEQLSLALDSLRSEAVEAIVSLGDTTDRFGAWDRATEVAALMSAARVVGVWGNHDYALCREPSLELRARFSPATLEYMATICPQLEVGGCHFSHVEPWLDPLDPGKLWCFEGVPETEDRLRKCFDAVP